MSANERWVVTTDSANRSLKEIANDLSEAGFDISQTLDEVGVVIGTGDDNLVQRWRSIDGVVDASPESPVDVGPPDSPETW